MMLLTHRFIWTALVGCFTLLIIGLALPQASDAAVYKWRDETGKLHFTDQPHKIPKQYQQKHNKPVYGSIPSNTERPAKVSTAPASESGEPGILSAFDGYGRQVSITVGEDTALIAMATWRPYSKKLARFLSDPDVARRMQHLNLVFVFKDEWPYIKNWLGKSVKNGRLTQEEADKRLERYKEKSEGKIVYDTDFLNNLPGKHYFVTRGARKLSKIFPGSIPNVYSPEQEDFNQGVTRWLRTQFRNDEATQDFLVAEYKQYNKGRK